MLTPLDIENKKFSKQMMNGYNVDEVDDFLDELTADYEKLYKENSELKTKSEEQKNDLEKYRNIETTLQSTLMMAQSTAEEVKKQIDVYKAKIEALLISQLELLKDVKDE